MGGAGGLAIHYHINAAKIPLLPLQTSHHFAFFLLLPSLLPKFHLFHSFLKLSMPGLSVESLLRGSVSIQDKRGRGTRSRPSYSNSPYSGQKKHQRSTYGAEKLSTEKQWVQNHNSSQPAASFTANQEIDSPPPAYTETAKVSLPTPTPRPISRLSAPQVQPINTLPRLQYPVIIPQNPREGGFCRVYAPLLKECNVSESAFFYFLDDFDRSAEASPWFSAVNIASIGSLNRPHSTAMIVAIARKRYSVPETFQISNEHKANV